MRSPRWPDPTADRGKHSIDYALYPHAGRWQEANTVHRGYEYNNPLIAFLEELHQGALPLAHSFVQLTPFNLVLTTIKKAEDAEAWIVQWYEARGEDTPALLALPQIPKKVLMSDFLEADGAPIDFTKNTVKINVKKKSVVTVKVYF